MLGVSFFSLVVTVQANIINQSKEIAVLLGLGVQKSVVRLAFIFEALVIVVCSSSIGIAVGAVMGWVVGMQ